VITYYVTYKPNRELVATIEENLVEMGILCCCYAEDCPFDSLSIGSTRLIVVAATLYE